MYKRQGLCYSIGTSFDCYSDNGIFLSYAGTSGDKVKELSEVIATEFKDSITTINETEVERAKTQLRSSLLMGLENSSSRSERLARGLIIWDKIVEVQETISKIDSVSLQDVRNFGVEMFHNSSPAMALYGKVKNEIDKQSFHEAIKLIWAFISDANKYVDEQAPWKLRKTDERRMNDVLWILADTIRKIAIIVQPFMPDSSNKILDQLSIDISERDFSYLDNKHVIKTNKINSPSPIFPRIEE